MISPAWEVYGRGIRSIWPIQCQGTMQVRESFLEGSMNDLACLMTITRTLEWSHTLTSFWQHRARLWNTNLVISSLLKSLKGFPLLFVSRQSSSPLWWLVLHVSCLDYSTQWLPTNLSVAAKTFLDVLNIYRQPISNKDYLDYVAGLIQSIKGLKSKNQCFPEKKKLCLKIAASAIA